MDTVTSGNPNRVTRGRMGRHVPAILYHLYIALTAPQVVFCILTSLIGL